MANKHVDVKLQLQNLSRRTAVSYGIVF